MMAGLGLGRKALKAFGTAIVGGGAITALALDRTVKADDLILHPPKARWPHSGLNDSYDHASIRRGYQVYKQVCAACHSMQFTPYRFLVNEAYTEQEMVDFAKEEVVIDGPNADGDMFERPGKLFDYFPKPFPNEEKAAAANNGAAPPDLSLIVLAKEGGEDYVYHLLNGYCEAPAGVELDEGQHFNPYFVGGKISMAPPLYDEIIEYDDGTPATQSQLAYDVINFLKFCAQPEHDDRKKSGLKSLTVLSILIAGAWYMKRLKFASLKSRKIVFVNKKYAPK
jgi:ubiquinol-cytochrome c reductase cytochrome c1 subunit